MTRYWYDCEFLEDGRTIELISIGIVASDGREYHAVVGDSDFDRVLLSPWLLANVVPQLPLAQPNPLHAYLTGQPGSSLKRVREHVRLNSVDPLVKPRALIAAEVRDFLLAGDGDVELWADYGAYDHVVLCRLWGRMSDLPAGLPMFTHDLQQEAARLGLNTSLLRQDTGEHLALEDARMTRERWLWLKRRESLSALEVDLRAHEWAEVEGEPGLPKLKACHEVPCPPWQTVELSTEEEEQQ